jgi:hypothetical protein
VFVNNPGNAPPPHIFDTTVTGTTSPENVAWTFSTIGDRVLNYGATYSLTNCGIQPNTKEQTLNVYAVRCLPVWLRNTATSPIVHVQPTTIYVYISSGLGINVQQGIRDSIRTWNAALDPYRGSTVLPTFAETAARCGGAYCINMDVGTPSGSECAGGPLTYDSSTGEITSSNIYWPNASFSWNLAFDQRTAAHELAHHLGLQDNSSFCPSTSDGSVMKPVSCGAAPGNYPTSP